MINKQDIKNRLKELRCRVAEIAEKLKETTYLSDLIYYNNKLQHVIGQIQEAEGMLVILKQQEKELEQAQ